MLLFSFFFVALRASRIVRISLCQCQCSEGAEGDMPASGLEGKGVDALGLDKVDKREPQISSLLSPPETIQQCSII